MDNTETLLALAQYPIEPKSSNAIDMRSDTVTRPTENMRKAMLECAVDDAVLGEDPSVVALETLVATMSGKEAALFVSSGTMSNLIAIMAHCEVRGAEAILGDTCHIHVYEQGNIASIAGVHSRVLPTNPDGTLPLDMIEKAVRNVNDIHHPVSRLVCVENTHNLKGGLVLPVEWSKQCYELAQKHNLIVHTDGARLWNAAVELNLPLASLLQYTDSASLCLSKGLGAPAGSVLVGSSELIKKARRIRKLLGGGMRQIGILAACGIVAIRDIYMSGALKEDHVKTKMMAEMLNNNQHFSVNLDYVHSNLLFFDVVKKNAQGEVILAKDICDRAREKGLLLLPFAKHTLRAVLQHHITKEQTIQAVEILGEIIESL